MRICGIDPSTSCTGVSIVDVTFEPLSFTLIEKSSLPIKPSKKFAHPYLKKVEMLSLFEQYLSNRSDIDFFVFENYSYGSLGRLDDLAECCSLLKFKIHTLGKPFDVIAPTTVKKHVGGTGRAQKDEVQAGLKNYLSDYDSLSFKTYDESDAVAVAIAYVLKAEEEKSRERKQSRKDLQVNSKPRKRRSSK